MLGDAGSNALGALLGLNSVERSHGEAALDAIGALAGLTLLGEHRPLGALIERTPVFATSTRWGAAHVSAAPTRRSTSSSPAASSPRSARASSPRRSAGC